MQDPLKVVKVVIINKKEKIVGIFFKQFTYLAEGKTLAEI